MPQCLGSLQPLPCLEPHSHEVPAGKRAVTGSLEGTTALCYLRSQLWGGGPRISSMRGVSWRLEWPYLA